MGNLLIILTLGLLIGGVLGALGGGGAILTVPVLVYVVGESAQDATTASLVIVGVTAVAGVVSYRAEGRVRCRTGVAFGALGIPGTWLGSRLNQEVDESVLLLGFAVIMVLAAAAMLGDRRKPAASEQAAYVAEAASPKGAQHSCGAGRVGSRGATGVVTAPERAAVRVERAHPLALLGTALGVGALTGFFGVGGGFVIVPALVLVLRLPMSQAVGTSLMIVALNSGTALASRATTAHFDWAVIAPFTLAAVVASVLGKRVADRLPARRLQVAFAGLMVLVAGYTTWASLSSLWG